ncbi:MAG: PAS domain S-box protein [Deltaproteobacteria bacterium]|nr:PAS domain S-box protein [Deltaproteobacteria bacterium]
MHGSSRHRRLFLLIFAPLWILLTAAGSAWVAWDIHTTRQAEAEGVTRQVRQVTRQAEAELGNLVSDTKLLGFHPELGLFKEPWDYRTLELLGQAYRAFGRSKPGFLRLSLLAPPGQQWLAVDCWKESIALYPQGAPASPQAAALAAQAASLAPHELVLAALPPPPGQRDWLLFLALPLRGVNGRGRSVILVEFSGAEFVRSVSRGVSGPGELWLLDRRGQALFHLALGEAGQTARSPAPPVLGAGGRPAENGRFSQAEAFFPLREALKFSTGGGEATLTSALAARLAGEERWTWLVRRVGPAASELLGRALRRLLPSYLAASLTLGIACWLAAGVWRRRLERQTNRRLAQERFRIRTAFENSAVGIAVVSLKGRILEANQYLVRWLGAQEEGLVGQSVGRFLPPQDFRRLLARFEHLLSGKIPSLWAEVPLVTTDGQTRYGLLSLSLATDQAGRPLHSVAHLQDITRAKELAREKEVMEGELRRALKLEAIGTLASGVAHDFNNLLGIVLTNTELCLRQDTSDAPCRPRLEQILLAGHRGRDLVRQIMNIYQPEEQPRTAIPLGQALAEVLQLLSASIPPHIQMASQLPEPGPLVCAAGSDIQQVVTNLCLNAVHAMPGADGRLTVILDTPEEPGPASPGDGAPLSPAWARLMVRDNGCGMDEATQARAFDPFFTTKGQGQGTGLGLATVQRVVTSLGGRVELASQPGQGTTVSVLLPICEAAPAPAPVRPAPRAVAGHLLVVDDEAAYAGALQEALESCGFQVTACTSPLAAEELFRRQPARFAALITDHHMPGLAGSELAARARGCRPGLPVVLCTGSPQELVPAPGQDAEAWCVLRKPFTIQELLEVLGNLLPEGDPSAGS